MNGRKNLKVFLDTNIVIDLLERREPFSQDAVRPGEFLSSLE